MREEFANYFNALQAHPRMLQGTEVPAIGREGTEVLRDSDDAREWQEAAKLALQQEAQRRVEAAKAEANDLSQLVNSSVQMFQNNVDLVPGSALFDKELADKFFEAVEPYGVRNEGKLIGYSIPVQPLLDRVRGQLAAQRGSGKPQAAAGAPASAPKAQPSSNKADAPQTGIRSKAGSGGEKDDWDTFASAVGLPRGVL